MKSDLDQAFEKLAERIRTTILESQAKLIEQIHVEIAQIKLETEMTEENENNG